MSRSRAGIALLVAGAHKAGTTALYRWLCEHPALAGHAQPELAFFVDDAEFARGDDAYRRYGPPDGVRDRRPFVAKHVKLMYAPAAAERLCAHSPEARVVVLLRHPVERAHSAYWHARARGRETLASFEAALDAEERRLADGMAPWHDTAYVRNGLYMEALERLEQVFPRERLRVFLDQDLAARPRELCATLFADLGVDPGFAPAVERTHNRGRAARSPGLARALEGLRSRRAGLGRLRAFVPQAVRWRVAERLHAWNALPLERPPLAPATRARLLERFAPGNAALARHLDRDLSAWER